MFEPQSRSKHRPRMKHMYGSAKHDSRSTKRGVQIFKGGPNTQGVSHILLELPEEAGLLLGKIHWGSPPSSTPRATPTKEWLRVHQKIRRLFSQMNINKRKKAEPFNPAQPKRSLLFDSGRKRRRLSEAVRG